MKKQTNVENVSYWINNTPKLHAIAQICIFWDNTKGKKKAAETMIRSLKQNISGMNAKLETPDGVPYTVNNVMMVLRNMECLVRSK